VDPVLSILSILGALSLGTMSPGPSFVMVARTAVARSRGDGLAAALGMGVGAALFGSLAMAGLMALLAQVEWLYVALRLAGGAYLLYLGLRIWRGAGGPLTIDAGRIEDGSLAGSFWTGLVTQVSNPKTAVVYTGVFAALLPSAMPAWMPVVLPPLLFGMEAGWYALVACAFSADRPRAAYLRFQRGIDRAAGSVMALLGLKLVVSAARG
jgi:threonine/homoserine/homoserine lactone efflux protein